MRAGFKVLKTGLFDSIQDAGRFGHRHAGIPTSGFTDAYHARLSNHILGNTPDSAVLEITGTGPKLRCESQTAVCLCGADFPFQINGQYVLRNTPVHINKGDELEIGGTVRGFRAYLAVLGGFQTEKVLGSQSMLHPITKKSRIHVNDFLPLRSYEERNLGKGARIRLNESIFLGEDLEVIRGPEFDLLSEVQKRLLLDQNLRCGSSLNRMGISVDLAFDGDARFSTMLSKSILPGMIQATSSGRIMILLNDAQTTGGYPRVLQLTEKGMIRAAQLRPHSSFRFSMLNAESGQYSPALNPSSK